MANRGMIRALPLALVMLASCAHETSVELHQKEILALRATLPYQTKIGYSHSMEPLFMRGLLGLLGGGQVWDKYPKLPMAEYDSPVDMVAKAHLDAAERGGEFLQVGGTTHSMSPTLEIGDGLVVVHKAPADWKEGDIVMYKAPWLNSPCATHRIVAKDKWGWIPSGDNNPRSEPQGRVTPDNYRGTVVSVHRVKKKK